MRKLQELFREPPRSSLVPDFVLGRALEFEQKHSATIAETGAAGITELRTGLAEVLGIDRLSLSDAAPRCVGHLPGDGFVIEKLVYEAIPGLPIPAHLYLPSGGGPHPAVVHTPGHWMENAKLDADIQLLNIRLARSGIAVLCYDTLGEGERRVGWHQHGQLAPLLVGLTSLGVMVTESRAALGVLSGRVDIDPARLGMTGTSGGGFSTIFAAALDERVSAAAIACIVNSHAGQIRDAAFGTGWDGWVDLCNQVPRLCTVGSMAQLIACAAPRRTLVVHAEDDPPFPLASARNVAEDVRGLYESLGASDGFDFVEVAGGHGLHPATRAAVTGFFCRVFETGEPVRETEGQHLLAAPWAVTHDVARAERPQERALGDSTDGLCLEEPVDSNKPLVRAARERAAHLRLDRPPLTTAALVTALGPFPERTPLAVSVGNHMPLPGGYGQRVAYQPEPGVTLDAVCILPDDWSDSFPAVFVMLDEGGKEEAHASVEANHAADAGCALFLPDLRGTGESAASEFEVATAAWMLDRDLLNQRVWDTLRGIDLLSERYSTGQQIDKGRIIVWGSGAFGLIALIAGALDRRIAAVGATGLVSLEDLLVENSRVTPMAYCYRLLETLDIDDLVQLAAPRAHVAMTRVSAVAAIDAALASLTPGGGPG